MKKMNFVPMPRYQMRQNALKKLLKENNCSGKKLLELGYGAGEVFNLYQKLDIRVWGYDFSEIAYEYAKQHYIHDNIHLLEEKEDIRKEKYDFVVACEVLEHIEDDVQSLREWKDYLAEDGRMIISVPAHQSRWGGNDVYSGHFRRYEREELKEKFGLAGMEVIKICNYDWPACLVLDGLRDHSRAKKLKEEDKSIIEHTKSSGVERNFNPLVIALSHPIIWLPIVKLAQLFYHTDWGSAYILIAKKV